jgi:peptide/nickel transport system substrate-binding protein
MSYAVDHDEMLNKLFYGLYEPASGPFHYSSWMAPKPSSKPFKQNLDKAEDLLDEAGWTDSDGNGIRDKVIGGKKVPFEFSLSCATSPVSQKVCELVKESLDRIGVICHVKPMEWTVLQQENLEHKFQATFGGWGTGTDPSTTENIFGSKGDRNYGQYENAEVDRLFAEGLKEFDKEKRGRIYARIHEILYDEQAYTWLYYRNSFYGFNKSLRGYRFSPRGPFHYGPGFSSIWKPVAVP